MKHTSAEEYRRRAHECLAAARSTAAPGNRAFLTERAAYWLRLAQELDEEAANVEPPVPPSLTQDQPVVQQQQQVQPDDREGED